MARVILSRRISFAKNFILAEKVSFRSSPLRQAAGRQVVKKLQFQIDFQKKDL